MNRQDVTQMSASEFTRFLRTAVQNIDARGQPLVLDIRHDRADPSSLASNTGFNG